MINSGFHVEGNITKYTKYISVNNEENGALGQGKSRRENWLAHM